MKTQATFSELLQAYFTQRLMHECNASPHTIANYRDRFRLLIGFAHRHLKKPPTALAIQDLDASFVCRFLDHLEKDRGVSARSRNGRLAAIHSFFHYVALQEPALGARCTGKGRNSRSVALRKETVTILRAWLRERNAQPDAPLFPNLRGKPLSRDGVQYLLAKHVASARQHSPSLTTKRVSPHVLRHSTAMDLLQCGVDRSVIALWLDHERMDTTQIYLHASLELKEKALAKTEPF